VTTFDYHPTYAPVIVAELRGTEHPDQYVMVGAHLDSRMTNSADPTARAPGADDNGSGTSAIMELARVFTSMNYTYAFSVQFLLFSGEEQVRRRTAQAWTAVTVRLTQWSALWARYNVCARQGLLGSEAYAEWLVDNNVDVVAMFNGAL